MIELIGLLPAAGRGSRLGPIPCSKEIMPLGFARDTSIEQAPWKPVTAIEDHLRAFKQAGVTRTAVIISESKSDVVRYLGDGSRYGLSISYMYQQQLQGMPYALDLATPWVGTATTLFAMPDTLISPTRTMSHLVEHHLGRSADLTLGLFSTTTPHKFGMVKLDAVGEVVAFVDKPQHSDLQLMWGLAVWSPAFSRFLHVFLSQRPLTAKECVLSDVFEAALTSGLDVQGVVLSDAHYHDIGTPEDFQAVVFELAVHQSLQPQR